jgi:hypothetical protein
MNDAQLKVERSRAHESEQTIAVADAPATTPKALVLIAWLAVGIPLAWGIWNTVVKALPLFR